MRIHHLQHVPFEDLGSMQVYFTQRGDQLSATHLYQADNLPALNDFDVLIVMGGPMGVADTEQYPWLAAEKRFIAEVIQANKPILGICLGAQLLAEALGAQITPNPHREIGWFPITRNPELNDHPLASALPTNLDVFHWHGDTFSMPPNAQHLASSAACQNQGFIVENRIIGLQFHLETTLTTAAALIDNCREDLDGSQYVQTEAEMLVDSSKFDAINWVMQDLLGRFLS